MTYQLDRHSEAYRTGEKAYKDGVFDIHIFVKMNGGFTGSGDFTEYGFNLYEGYKEAEITDFFTRTQL